MSPNEILLVAMTIVFTGPFLLWRLGRTDYYAPLVVVQIIFGILLGPGVAGSAFPGFFAAIFNRDTITALNGIALWGVMAFVFVAGVELDLREAWRRRSETFVTASLALIAPLASGAAAAFFLATSVDHWVGPNGGLWQFILGVGMACAVTALPILVLLMERLEIIRRPLGQRILRYASLDDIAIWAVLALILMDWARLGRQALFLVAFAASSFAYRRLMPQIGESDRWFVALIWLVSAGLFADWVGLHFIVGAFLAGVVSDADWFDRARMDHFRQTVLIILMPVFFLITGLRTNWTIGGSTVFAAAGLLLFASITGKLAGTHLAGRLLKWEPGEATIIGWLLQTKALIMIIFANVLLDKGIISSETFTALLLTAVGSTMLTIPIVTPKLKRLSDMPDKG